MHDLHRVELKRRTIDCLKPLNAAVQALNIKCHRVYVYAYNCAGTCLCERVRAARFVRARRCEAIPDVDPIKPRLRFFSELRVMVNGNLLRD